MNKYKLGDKFIVISSDVRSVNVGDTLEFQRYTSEGFNASGWFINSDLTMGGFPKTKLKLLEENKMNKFKEGDIVKLISKNNNTALNIGDIGTLVLLDTDGTCKVNTSTITKGNWTRLSDLELVKRENKMNEINIKVPEGYIVDEENSSFNCIKFKKETKKEVNCWEDLKIVSGYYISADAEIENIKDCPTEQISKNVFATKEQAEACIALAMLSQLMKDVNGDWIPDWTNEDTYKYIISFDGKLIRTDWYTTFKYFLSFPTNEIRDTFLKNHEELILKAKPLL